MSWVLPVVIVFLAGILTGLTGFGFSVLSVPLLLLLFTPHEVVVIALGLVPVTSAVLLLSPGLRGRIRLRTVATLTGFSVLGLPVGIVLFEYFDPLWVTGLTGIVLVGYAVYGLKGSRTLAIRRRWVAPSGVLGGILATSTGLSGPAVAMYVHGRRVSPREQAATMAAYVGAISVLGLGLLTLRGAVSLQDLQPVAKLAAGAVAGTVVGRWWATRQHATIDRLTLVALGFMGLLTLARSVITWMENGSWV
ncbi:sulfite exporter TauE/SafE family protein [Knoellia locipacati]|uniref:sulfite exporter TauE/SafE family protein n=1 Tax=Knoellia locipacati TaxID=882824 RepID=UPI00384F6F71